MFMGKYSYKLNLAQNSVHPFCAIFSDTNSITTEHIVQEQETLRCMKFIINIQLKWNIEKKTKL